GTGAYMMCCPVYGGGGIRYAITVNGYSNEKGINGPTFPVGTWTNVAVTLSGSTGTLYLNGTSVGTHNAMTLNPASLGITNNNYIGKSQFSSDNYFPGLIDEFKIYGRALSASEITTLASGSIAAPASLTATAGYSQIACVWSNVAGATSYNIK